MKAIKLYALLGSVALAATCVPQALLAAESDTKSTNNGKNGQAFDEMKAGKLDRGPRLDQLFALYATENQNPSKDIAKAADASKGKMAATQVSHNHTSAHAPAKTITVAKGNQKSTQPIEQLAIYKGSNHSSNDVLAVSHVVSNSSTPVISATLDRPGTVPQYKAGDHMVIKLKALQDCNVRVFDFDNKGTLTQLYPNDFERSETMKAGQVVELGGNESQYTLDIDGKGLEQIFVYAYPVSESMSKIEVAMAPITNTPFRSAHMTISQYRDMVAHSREYFAEPGSNDRSVSIKAKNGAQPVSLTQTPANKLELVFQIDK